MDTEPWWKYRAQPDPFSDHERGAVDGDTLDLLLDQGDSTYGAVRVRLDGIDTAETWGTSEGSPEHEAGETHAAFVRAWLTEAAVEHDGAWPLVVTTDEDEDGKYGRLLADVSRRHDGANLNDDLADEFPSVVDE